jgi:glycine oxidase
LELHAAWAVELQAQTGIDNGYRRCGGLYLARTPGEAAALAAWAGTQADEQIAVERLSPARLAKLEPQLAPAAAAGVKVAYSLPGEVQVRNPRHLKALRAACQQAGVEITSHLAALGYMVANQAIEAVETSAGPLTAQAYCFTSGAWTQRLLAQLGIETGILPIRGQMVLFKCPQPPVSRIVNDGPRYIVPRDDGYVLVGATEEEVGFDKRNTVEAVADLVRFAHSLVPALADATIERTWAGLRPATFDAMPYLGPLPGLDNAFVAAGHYRSGIYLSPGTAVVMSQLICGTRPEIDLAPFRVGR